MRPVIREAMQVAKEDGVVDRLLKYEPERVPEVTRTPEPERVLPDPPAPLLFNVGIDPFEEHDLADEKPELVTRLLHQLEGWFEEVDRERRQIDDQW